jgi:hypothetical protein
LPFFIIQKFLSKLFEMKLFRETLIRFEKDLTAVVRYQGISDRKAGFLLIVILAFTAAIRLATLNSPPIDRTDWKEIDHIMISGNFHRNGYNFFKPEISWPAEEPRITAMELPVAPYLAALFYAVFGENVFSVRLTTFLAFLLLIVYVYKLVKREAGVILALLSAFFAAVFPLFSSFGNLLFSEPLVLFFSVFAIYQLAQWIGLRKKGALALFILSFSLAVALNPPVLYMLIPVFWIFFRRYKFEVREYWNLVWPLALSMVIPVLWFVHAYYLAKNHIDVFGVFGGLFGGHDKFQTIAMLSDPEWYLTMYWRVKMILLGESGLILMLAGIVTAMYFKIGRLFIAYLVAVLSFFVIVAEGQIDVPYRQLSVIPAASFLIALGAVAFSVFIYGIALNLFRTNKKRNALVAAVSICLLFLAVFPVRKPYLLPQTNNTAPRHKTNWLLAQEIKKIATDSSAIIMMGEYTIHKGGNDFSPVTYYYSGLRGWSLQDGQWTETVIDELKAKGADLLGAVEYNREPELEKFLETLSEKYEVLYSNPRYGLLLLNLNR